MVRCRLLPARPIAGPTLRMDSAMLQGSSPAASVEFYVTSREKFQHKPRSCVRGTFFHARPLAYPALSAICALPGPAVDSLTQQS